MYLVRLYDPPVSLGAARALFVFVLKAFQIADGHERRASSSRVRDLPCHWRHERNFPALPVNGGSWFHHDGALAVVLYH
jgi:hypothetical protein